MNRKIVAAATAAIALAAPAAANASYYLSRGHAESNARSYVRERYDSERPVAACRPQGRNAPEQGYIYHRWVCGWADEYGCEGKLLIIGSRGDYYYARVLRGQRCPR